MTEISYLIVNTNGREHLLRGLEAAFATMPPLDCEVWVLDNASSDGSAEAVRERWGDRVGLIASERRAGKPANDNRLLEASTGRFCLMLNEDTQLLPGAVEALREALLDEPGAAIAGTQLVGPDGVEQPCAWRFPSVATATAGAVFLHRLLTVQSGGDERRRVDWIQSSAMMVRRAAYEQIGGLDPRFFVYSDEVDWCRRFADAGWATLYVPEARAVHHEQLAHDAEFSERRIVEFHRNRDRYMRKHHSSGAAAVVRALTAWSYAIRALGALVMPGRSPARFWLHARRSLAPARGESVADAAAQANAKADAAGPS